MPDDATAANPTQGLAAALFDEYERRQPGVTAARHSAVDALVTNWLEAHEADLCALVRPHVEPHLQVDHYPQHLRDLFGVLAAPEHQTQFFTALFAIQGIINVFVQAAVAPYVQDVSSESWKVHPHLPLSPAEAADAVLKQWKSRAEMADEASLSGIDSERFDLMVQLAGEPPGIMAMLDLWRRKLVSDADLERAIHESRVRDEWIDAVKLMATNAPSTAQVLAGYVEGHLSEADARERWAHAGGRAEDFDWEYETAGRPPGVMEMLHLLNRGQITEAEARAAIRESDIKNKYIDNIIALRRYLPPPRSIVAMIRQGAIDDAQATEYLKDAGVDAAAIEVFIKSGHATRASAHKQVSVSKAIDGYESHVLTRPQAQSIIEANGYPSNEASQLLDIADAAIVHRAQQAAASHTHSLYTRYRMTRNEASAQLDALGVTSTQRDALLTVWDLERKENKPQLTHTQVTGAWRRSKVSDEWAMQQLTAMGYTEAEAWILLIESIPPTKFPLPQIPPKP